MVEARLGPDGTDRLNELLKAGEVRVVAFDGAQSRTAHRAWEEFRRGNSPARLNLGDCFSYSLAKETGRPLLFKGNDFTKTDTGPAA